MTLSILDILSVVMISQFLFLIFAVRIIPNTNTQANKILQFILAIFCFFLLERLLIVYQVKIDKTMILRYGFVSNVLFYLLGPFIYTYIRRLIIDDNSPYFPRFKHFISAAIYFIYMLFHIAFYDEIISDIYLDAFSLSWQLTSVLSISFYLYQSKNLLQNFARSQKLNLSFDQAVIKYVRIMLGIIAAIMICWIISIVGTSIFRYAGFGILALMWILYGILAYVISFYSLKYPQIFRLKLVEEPEIRQDQHRLTPEEIVPLKARLQTYIDEEKPYRRPDLKLSTMAREVETSPNNLSWLLNNVYHQSFYDFVNQYRVEEFIKRVQQHEHKGFTLLSIAEKVGFKSKSTFYKAFKSNTGKTPTEYLREMEGTET